MQISWHGLSSFHINTKPVHDEVGLVIDPYQNDTGLRFPRTLSADIVVYSEDTPAHNNVAAVSGEPFIINEPGEYEVKNVFVYGINAPKGEEGSKKTPHVIYRIESEDMTLLHLGALDRNLTEAELEAAQNVDILMLPVGGGSVMSPKIASDIIGRVEPRMIIPMYYALPNVKEKLDKIDVFCKELGVCKKEEANKLKIAKKDLPQDEMLIVVLSKV